MESSEPTPPGAITAPALVELAARTPGPFATVYMTTEHAVENGAHRSEVRWKSLRDELVEGGAPEEVLRPIEAAIPDAHTQGDCLAAFATPNGLVHLEHALGVRPLDLARWAPSPSLLPLIGWRQERVPFVAVIADRVGADLFAMGLDGPEVEREVEGADWPVTKVKPGGWSQRRIQQRAENTWEHNADEVAGQVVRLADLVHPRALIVAGDVRAVGLLREALPERLAESIHELSTAEMSGRPAGHLPPGVDAVLSDVTTGDTARLIERFHEGVGQRDRAADGAEAVLDALRRAQVEVLLIGRDDPDDRRTAWFGPEPVHAAIRPVELLPFGARPEDLQQARLPDVLVRATLGTGAGVRVVPRGAGPKGDVGAILRWSE
jgi:Bacterial archaeo-eukaryotic release factor family 2